MSHLIHIYTPLLVAWLGLSALVCGALLFIEAPYGRYSRSGFGPKFNRRLGWVLMEAPAVLGMAVFFAVGDRHHNTVAWVFMGLWQLHYLRRTFIFPFLMRGDRGHMLLLIVVLGALFNTVNTYLIGMDLFVLGPLRSLDWLVDPRFIGGVALFFTGMLVNTRCDAILRNLRKPGETDYKLPQGGLFRYVSAANYSGELLEWLGFALATWSIGAFTFFVWTSANLIPRALSHHRWYQSRFPEQAPSKAIIPFIL